MRLEIVTFTYIPHWCYLPWENDRDQLTTWFLPVTPSQSFTSRDVSRDALGLRYGTFNRLLFVQRRTFWNATLRFCSFATWFSFSFTQSHLRVWFITVFDSPEPGLFVGLTSSQHRYSLNKRIELLVDVWVWLVLLRSRALFHTERRVLHWVKVFFFWKNLFLSVGYNTRL